MARLKFRELSVTEPSRRVTGLDEPVDGVMADHTARAQGEGTGHLNTIKDKQGQTAFQPPATA